MALECAVDNWKKTYTLQRFFRNAVCQNDVTTVKGLIMHQRDEIDLDAWNSDGICPIHQCCIDGNKKLMSILLKAGANVNAADPKGWTSLHTSAAIGNYDLTKYLIRNGADIMAETISNELPIDLSFNVSIGLLLGNAMKSQGYVEEAEFYMSKIKDYQKSQSLRRQSRLTLEQKKYIEENGLMVYPSTQKEECIRRERKLGSGSLSGYQPPERSSRSRNYKLTRQREMRDDRITPDLPLSIYPISILKKYDNYDSSSSSSSSSGQNSPSSGYSSSRTSSTASDQSSLSNEFSRTLSSSSSCSDEGECFEVDGKKYPILKRQFSVQFDSEVLFMNYVQENEFKRLSLLLEDLEDMSILNSLDRKGLSAVHWAAIKGYPDCISVLESFGAHIDITDPFGWTPLHAAVVTNNTECVKKLLELNADLYALTKDGESVFDWPVEEGILNILRNNIRDNIAGREIRCTTI